MGLYCVSGRRGTGSCCNDRFYHLEVRFVDRRHLEEGCTSNEARVVLNGINLPRYRQTLVGWEFHPMDG